MRYIKLYAETPFRNTEATAYMAIYDGISDEDIWEICERWAGAHCSRYEHLAHNGYLYYKGDRAIDKFYEDCGWGYIDITKEEFLSQNK